MREAAVLCVIADLQQPPDGPPTPTCACTCSAHRLVKPRELNLDGIFGALPNVAWTSLGPVDPANLTHVQLKARASGTPLQVFSLDKFPRMTDYVDAVRACASPTPTACGSAPTWPRARR